MIVNSFGCCCVDGRGPLRVLTAGDPVNGDVELDEGRYWDDGLCTGIGGNGGVWWWLWQQ